MKLKIKYNYDDYEVYSTLFGIAERNKKNKYLMELISWFFYDCREELCDNFCTLKKDTKFKIVMVIPFKYYEPNLKTIHKLEERYGLKKTILKTFTGVYSSYERQSEKFANHCFYFILDKKWTNTTIMLSAFLSIVRHDTGDIDNDLYYEKELENTELILKNYKYIFGNKTIFTQNYDEYDYNQENIGIFSFGNGSSIFEEEYEKFIEIKRKQK